MNNPLDSQHIQSEDIQNEQDDYKNYLSTEAYVKNALNGGPTGALPYLPDLVKPKHHTELPSSLEDMQKHGYTDPPKLNSEEKTQYVQNYINSTLNGIQAAPSSAAEMGKEYSVDASDFERYYIHPNFEKLGYKAGKDNEQIYNENSTWADDFVRASSQWGSLVGLGFQDVMGFGDLSDKEAAAKMAHHMELGQSSKEGVGSFITNLYLNSGYTVGIMSEMVLEELALGAITAASFGTAAPVTGAIGATRAVKAIDKVKDAWQATTKTLKALDKMKDINNARSMFKSMGNFGKGAANFLNPLAETTHFLQNAHKLDNVSKLAKTTMGFGNFYRDVRNVRMAWGEGALEAGGVELDTHEQLVENYMETHGGKPPEGEELEKIRTASKQAAKATHWQNGLAIFYSNKIVFDSMFKSFSPVRRLMNDNFLNGKTGKVILNTAKQAKKTGKHLEFVEKGWKNGLKASLNPRTYAKGGLNYFKANFAEGIQESVQEVIAGANKDHYMDLYNSGEKIKEGYFDTFNDVFSGGYYDNLSKSVASQFSAEGFEVFASGFLMGGMIQPITKVMDKSTLNYGKDIYTKFTDKGQYTKLREEKNQRMRESVDTLNKMYANPLDYFASDLENLMEQNMYKRGMKAAQANGDAKALYDLKHAAETGHIMTMVEGGLLETFQERFKELQNLTNEEIQNDFGMDPEKFRTGVDLTIERSNELEKSYRESQKLFPNPYDPGKKYKNHEDAKQEKFNYIAWEKARRSYIFNRNAFKNTLERKESILNSAKDNAALNNTPVSEFNVLFDIQSTENEIQSLKESLASLNDEGTYSKETKARKKDLQTRLDSLQEFSEAMTEFIVNKEIVEEAEAEVKGGKLSTSLTTKPNVDKLYKAYKSYVKQIASVNGDYVFDDNIEQAFQKIIDYHALNKDADGLAQAINTLSSLEGFSHVQQRTKEVHEEIFNNKTNRFAHVLSKFHEAKDSNALLQLLADKGIFFDPVDVTALIQEGKLPKRLYDSRRKQSGKYSMDELSYSDPRYQEALELIRDFGIEIMNLPIQEKFESAYSPKSRNKHAKDKRTYSDLAEQFGFDPKSAETQVPLKQVLDAVINSEFVTNREIQLAKRLKALAVDGEVVTFVNNGKSPLSFGETTQSVIDARYTSANFDGGQVSTPLEHIILHNEIIRRTSDAVENDSEFRGKMTDIYQEAISFARTEEGSKLVREMGITGLNTLDVFIAEAMTNSNFQNFLSRITYDPVTQKSSWVEFVDSLVKALKGLFKTDYTNTALNAAVDVITTKLDGGYTTTYSSTATTKPKSKPIVNSTGEAGDKADLSMEQLARLEELGYNINDYNYGQIQQLLKEDISYQEREDMEAAAFMSEQDEIEAILASELADLQRAIDAIETYDEYKGVEQAAFEIVVDFPGVVNTTELDQMFKEKLKDLAYNHKLEDFNVGERVIMANQYNKTDDAYVGVIEEIVDGSIKGYYLSSKVPFTIEEAEIRNRIMYKKSKAMTALNPQDNAMTDDDVQTSDQSQNNLGKLIQDPATTKAAIDKARKGEDSGWLDNINECK